MFPDFSFAVGVVLRVLVPLAVVGALSLLTGGGYLVWLLIQHLHWA